MSSTKHPRGIRAPRYVVLAIAALAAGGCGAVKVQPSASSGTSKLASRGRIDSPLTSMHNHLACLKHAHLQVQMLSPTSLRIGAAPGGATVVFTATPGAAQAYQIDGQAQGAEVIGSALLYPHQASTSELVAVEQCVSQGVQG